MGALFNHVSNPFSVELKNTIISELKRRAGDGLKLSGVNTHILLFRDTVWEVIKDLRTPDARKVWEYNFSKKKNSGKFNKYFVHNLNP